VKALKSDGKDGFERKRDVLKEGRFENNI